MNNNLFIITLLLCVGGFGVQAQSQLEAVLTSVDKNNPALAADRQYWEARKLEYQTGLTLPNPTIQGQYLFGSPATAGNQTDFFAVQPFDFPTIYKKRRALAAAQGALAASSIAARRQDILLEAKLICLEMIYRNKLAAQYDRRKADMEKLRQDLQTRLDKGESGILDVNKAKLQLLEISQLQSENDIERKALQNRLTGLNGGQALVFQDTVYPQLPLTDSFEAIEQACEAANPLRQSLEQERYVAERQVDLSKTWRLPKFEAGYHYQGILGQQFNGLHAGLTLPLWEHKYRVQQSQAQLAFADRQLQNHQNEHYFDIKTLYDRQLALYQSLEEYRSALAASSNAALLDKALRLGEISTVEYFWEISLYQNAIQHLLQLEWEYQKTVGELTRYQL